MRNLALVCSVLAAAACGSDDDTCDPIAQTGCDDGRVCEYVADDGAEPACFEPLEVRGDVFDLVEDTPVANARVVALDVNGAAVSSVAISDVAGLYSLPIPTVRNADGTPATSVELTLRADAAGYQTFPFGVRQALPIDTGTAVADGDGYVVENAQTSIGLISLPSDAGTASIYGTVELPEDGAGVLVVAETAGGAEGFASIANLDGDYRIFNVPEGELTVTAYSLGVDYEAVGVTVAADDEAEADLSLTGEAAGTVAGTVQIVNAPGGSTTSVILVVESTFDELVIRGQTVPGLRDPEPGIAPNIEGEYSIEGVPAGQYVVLAAFENDHLVRDPDLSIGGTSILHISVSPGQTTTVEGFKVTEALELFGPGGAGPEMVDGAPTFSWADDSSEDQYLVEVFDTFGELIWDSTIAGSSGADPSVAYEGPALESGMYYQWRATSSKDGVAISRTEDLMGVFFVP